VPDSAEDRLDSWKEIAAYLRRGVRTVRRWERDEGLPVHRHVHRVLGSVYAFKSEIDSWQQTGRRRPAAFTPARGRGRDPAVSEVKSIAVLPFANLSTDPENEYFADGLTDEVTADLSRIGSLRVISRTSAMTFKRTTKDVSTIARGLGVRYILEGSVRRAGDRLRITAELIDAATDNHLWADKFDGSVEDVFAIQERLARVIVDALQLRLTADEDRRLADRPIADVHAYQCYLRARHEAWRWRGDAIDHAVQLLQNGLALVGDNARLYAALGHAYLQYREAGIDVGERPLQEAEACAEKVIALESASTSVPATRLDSLLPRADSGRCSRFKSGARDRWEQRGRAPLADELLSDLGTGLGRASTHRACTVARSAQPGDALYAGICRAPGGGLYRGS
jgi:TolB-like protein